MKTLILCVDRDDDVGGKAHLTGPFIGREANFEAGAALALADPEDPDANTVLAAVSMYDELSKRGMEVQVATIVGSQNVGLESDRILAQQLEKVMETVKADRAILVSNGAEDEYFYPVISSRIKIDSVRRVFIKQTPTVEGVYYILIKTLKDRKMRRKLLAPISAILMVYGFFLMFSDLLTLSRTQNIGYLSTIAPGLITFVIGLYLIWYAYDLGEHVKKGSKTVWRAVRSGSQMLPFAIVTAVMVVLGLLYATSTVISARNVAPEILLLIFVSSFLWIGVFAAFVLEVGRFVNVYISSRGISWSSITTGLMFLAIGLIIQGAIDSIKLIYHLVPVSTALIIVEVVAGILTAMFGGLLNFGVHGSETTPAEEPSPSERTEGADLGTRVLK